MPFHRRASFLIPAALLLPVLVVLVAELPRGERRRAPMGDTALLEMDVRDVLAGEQSLGPYSRFGWRHPGPALPLVLAGDYALSGGSSHSLFLSAVLLNLLAWGGVLLLLRRRWEEGPPGLAVALLLMVWLHYLQPTVLTNPWNPYITLVPFLLWLLLLPRWVAEGRGLFLLALIGTFLIQSHVAYLPPVAVLFVVGAVLRGRRPWAGRWGLAATAVGLAALWAPPLLQELGPGEGNLHRMLSFFWQAPPGPPWSHVLDSWAREVAAVPAHATGLLPRPLPAAGWLPPDGQGVDPFLYALGGLIVLALPAAAHKARRRGDERTAAGALLALVGLAVALLALHRVQGPLYPYLALWVSCLGVFALIEITLGLALRRTPAGLRPSPTALLGGLLVVALGLDLWEAVRTPLRPEPGGERIEALARAIEAAPAPRILHAHTHDAWPEMVGAVLELEKQGEEVPLAPLWSVLVGEERTVQAAPTLVLMRPRVAERYARRPDHEILGEAGGIVLAAYDSRWQQWAEADAYRRTLDLQEERILTPPPGMWIGIALTVRPSSATPELQIPAAEEGWTELPLLWEEDRDGAAFHFFPGPRRVESLRLPALPGVQVTVRLYPAWGG